MNESVPLFIEIGCEELPAGAQQALAQGLAEELKQMLAEQGVAIEPKAFWTARRLIAYAPSCPKKTPERVQTHWGPPKRIAFDEHGKPTPALLGFAKRVGVSIEEVSIKTHPDKGEAYACLQKKVEGRAVADLIAQGVAPLLRRLPMPKRMRWGEGKARSEDFLRPIRWIVALLGEEVIPVVYAGVQAGNVSFGHRVMGSKGAIDPNDPIGWLKAQGVIADAEERKALIRAGIEKEAKALGGQIVADEALIEETAGLVEYPHAIGCRFDEAFLALPDEVIRTTLKHHQRCFVVAKANGDLLPGFVAVANLKPPRPDIVRRGYERVVRARLADAMFYFERDPRIALADRVPMLKGIVYQQGLGTMHDLAMRLARFAELLCEDFGCECEQAKRAAMLCKADLTTGLVGEFPELQGIIGGVYARKAGEDEAIAQAIAEHLRPQGAEDELPRSPMARLIGIAERADRLLGAFTLGYAPTATSDPFAVRRAAIGLIRLLADPATPLAWPLARVLVTAQRLLHELAPHLPIDEAALDQALQFTRERMLGMAKALGTTRTALAAAFAARTERSVKEEIEAAQALARFAESEEGVAAASANKRVANILRKAGVRADEQALVQEGLLQDEAERALWQVLRKTEANWPRGAKAQIAALAALRAPIDRFFDQVLVMCEDDALRANRLALLARMRALFLRVGDFSLL